MNKKIRTIMIYILLVAVIVTVCIGFRTNKEELISKDIEDTLHKYFETNNPHIAAHNFVISDVVIRCKGNDAYLVEFNLSLDGSTSKGFNKLGATIYKKNKIWYVKGFGFGLTAEELKTYDFKCYY